MKCKRTECPNPAREYRGMGQPPKYCSLKCAQLNNRPSPERRRKHKLSSNYGISVERYDQMLAAQGGACAICGVSGPEDCRYGVLVIDHDHETGEVRGLLCPTCNSGIGLLGDNLETVQRAVEYLAASSQPQEGVK